MTTNDSLDAFISAYVSYLDGEAPRPSADALAPEHRAEAAARAHLLEAARPVEPDADALDRIARQFGFDRAGTRIVISGMKFKAARQRKNLDLKAISAAANSAGATIRTSDLLNLETKGDVPIEQETVSVLVAILGTTVDAIESDFAEELNAVGKFLAGPRFDGLLAEWLTHHDYEAGQLRRDVSDRVLTTQLRADDVTEAQLVELVLAILRSLE